MTQICYRQLMIEDKIGLLELFRRFYPVIVRMLNRLVYKALKDDVLSSSNVIIYIASLNSKLVGYVIASCDWSYFKCMFVLQHPLIGLVILSKRLKKKLNVRFPCTSDLRREDVDTLRGTEIRSKPMYGKTVQNQSLRFYTSDLIRSYVHRGCCVVCMIISSSNLINKFYPH